MSFSPLTVLAKNLAISLQEAESLSLLPTKQLRKEISRLIAKKWERAPGVQVDASETTMEFVAEMRKTIEERKRYLRSAHTRTQYIRIVKNLNTAKG